MLGREARRISVVSVNDTVDLRLGKPVGRVGMRS